MEGSISDSQILEGHVELYTERLRIRPLVEADWVHFLEINLDVDINRYVRHPESVAQIREKFDGRLKNWFYASGDWLTLVIEEISTNEFVGFTGLHCDDVSVNRAEVGYLLAHSAQGKGYGTESLAAVVDWASLQFQVHKFVGHCAADNIGSRRVLEKCGFKLEGILRQHFKIGDDWVDDCAYGLLSTERNC